LSTSAHQTIAMVHNHRSNTLREEE